MSKILVALYVITSSMGLIFLKLGSDTGAPISFAGNKIHLNLNPYVISGIALYGFSFTLYMYLISKYDLGYIIPLTTAFVYILIFGASYIIFKEIFTATKILGIVLIATGVVLLNVKS